MENTVTLRPYQPADLEAIFRMDQTCFEEPFRFDRRSMRRFAEARNAITLIAETAAGDPTGFIILHLEREPEQITGYIVTLDVAPEQRRSGIAKLLMTEAEARSLAAGASSVALHVYTANSAALRFYEESGYSRRGTHPRFYGKKDGLELDAFLYRKQLEAP